MCNSLYVKVPLILVLALSLGLILWGLSQKKEPSSPSIKEKPFPYAIKIEDISYSTYDSNRLIARIEADEFKISPRRFWVFNIRPFNEATLTNARLEVHLYENMPSEVDLFSFGRDFLSLNKQSKPASKGMGLTTRGLIMGLILKVYKADRPSVVVKAKEAHIDFKRKETKLIRAAIENVLSKKLIKSRAIIWDNKEKVFKIPGEYIALTPKGITKGRGIKVDLDFVVSLLKPKVLNVPPASSKLVIP